MLIAQIKLKTPPYIQSPVASHLKSASSLVEIVGIHENQAENSKKQTARSKSPANNARSPSYMRRPASVLSRIGLALGWTLSRGAI